MNSPNPKATPQIARLRTLVVVVATTVLLVTSWYLFRVYRQATAVSTLKRLGAHIEYRYRIRFHSKDWESIVIDKDATLFGIPFLDRVLGPDWIDSPQAIFYLPHEKIGEDIVSTMNDLPELRRIELLRGAPEEIVRSLKEEFPACHVGVE